MVESTAPESPGDTRSRILAAAMSLFGEQGYAGTSVRDISERLGVTKAALYYHFPSKETILDALLQPFMSELARLVDLVRQNPPPGPRIVVERLAELMSGSGGVLLVFVNDPSIIHRKIGESDMLSLQHALVRALAGPSPSQARLLRAHCAIGALKSGIMGRALERAAATEPAASVGRGGAGCGPRAVTAGGGAGGEDVDAVCSSTLRSLATRISQGLWPLVTAAERHEIVAAALAALGGEDGSRRPEAAGTCV
ncbi:Transcriptional regulator, TetR family [Frankia canadensis]|uniref:Transcriptional regulator, TetR family n=1 Tax=Frankia canadensis TaxID=1836972 RepID=A0A2I2KL87_9ACTN|nr:TetR/AcrR family transcriptional regulator [Frankia canadensis]SNQ46439.1 Transcriptional regulator, TetR family [Frankia canadensis]SOU53729.1 Transcriptional regulator, TetR family [Frankia canadensis]